MFIFLHLGIFSPGNVRHWALTPSIAGVSVLPDSKIVHVFFFCYTKDSPVVHAHPDSHTAVALDYKKLPPSLLL